MIRFKKLPPNSHLHIEMHDADGNLVKVDHRKLSRRDFMKSAIGRHRRQQTISYDSGLSKDAGIAKIVIRDYQKQHDHEDEGQSE